MADIAADDFTKNLLLLLRETFEGPPGGSGSAYLEAGTGLFQTLDGITAAAASRPPRPGGATIAAHAAHLAYYVRVNHNYAFGRAQEVDWASSWRLQQVGDREWQEVRANVRREYAALMASLESLATWDDQQVGDSLAIVAHTAYHLGAIRHAMKNASVP